MILIFFLRTYNFCCCYYKQNGAAGQLDAVERKGLFMVRENLKPEFNDGKNTQLSLAVQISVPMKVSANKNIDIFFAQFYLKL